MAKARRYPLHLERAYRKRLVARQKSLAAALKKAMRSALGELAAGINERAAADNAGTDAVTLRSVAEEAYLVWLAAYPPGDQAPDLVRRARQIESVATARVARELAKLGAKDREWLKLDDAQAGFVAENVRLITSLSEQTTAQVGEVVAKSLGDGRTVREMQAAIDERFAVGQRRSLLIARDQVGSYNAQVTRMRHTELGVSEFIWSTAGDSNVRSEHAALDGEVFSYDEPPSEGLPGEPIGCRCTAIPVVPG